MKKNLLNNIISYLDKNVSNQKAQREGVEKARKVMLITLQHLLLTSPISPEDEGYNEGIEAAIREVKGFIVK
jgi:hypothetical protein